MTINRKKKVAKIPKQQIVWYSTVQLHRRAQPKMDGLFAFNYCTIGGVLLGKNFFFLFSRRLELHEP